MKITIEFDTDNAAFEDRFAPELSFVLRQARQHIADEASNGQGGTRLRDSNGNTIGEVRFS